MKVVESGKKGGGDVKYLAQGDVTMLKCTEALGSFHHIAEELLLNSLEAGSSTICIGVDISKCSLLVVDNGMIDSSCVY